MGPRPAGAGADGPQGRRGAVPARPLRCHPGHRSLRRPRRHTRPIPRPRLGARVGAGREQGRRPSPAARHRSREGAPRARARRRAARGPGLSPAAFHAVHRHPARPPCEPAQTRGAGRLRHHNRGDDPRSVLYRRPRQRRWAYRRLAGHRHSRPTQPRAPGTCDAGGRSGHRADSAARLTSGQRKGQLASLQRQSYKGPMWTDVAIIGAGRPACCSPIFSPRTASSRSSSRRGPRSTSRRASGPESSRAPAWTCCAASA